MILNTFDDTKGLSKQAKVGFWIKVFTKKMKHSINNFQKDSLQNTTICKDFEGGLKVFEIRVKQYNNLVQKDTKSKI